MELKFQNFSKTFGPTKCKHQLLFKPTYTEIQYWTHIIKLQFKNKITGISYSFLSKMLMQYLNIINAN
jgi:hypothetical protein